MTTRELEADVMKVNRVIEKAKNLSNAVSRFENRYMRGADVDDEIDDMMKKKNEFDTLLYLDIDTPSTDSKSQH